jgi:hypothetical protein
MKTSTDIAMGTAVSCTDGTCGRVTRVVIDPIAQVLTHLVVGPRSGSGRGISCRPHLPRAPSMTSG